MRVSVLQEDLIGLSPEETIDEYATCDLKIYVDKSLPYEIKQNLVIHAVIENFCLSWPHDKVEELGALIREALQDIT